MPNGYPRDPRLYPDISEDERVRFWQDVFDRATLMPRIGPARAQQVVYWMQRTKSWSLEDYDEYYADLQR